MGQLNVVLLYWDANVFITLIEDGNGLSERLGALLGMSFADGLSILTSELTLAELLVRPLREGNEERVGIYRDLLEPGGQIGVAPVHRDILLAVSQIRADHPTVKLPDAIHLATAELTNCQSMLTGDNRMPVRPSFRRINLDVTSLDKLIGRFDG